MFARITDDRLKSMAATASVAVATTLIGTKAAAWLTTGSVSLLSALVDSLLDLAASVVNLVAVRHAAQPADSEHRFGHGKAEPLAGLAQAAFVGGSAAFLVIQAGERLVRPVEVVQVKIGMYVMALSIVMTIMLIAFQRYVVRRTGSMTIAADSLHYRSDLLVNASVIVALLLTQSFGWTIADPLFAIGISVYILHGAWQIFQGSLNMLMDHELPETDRGRIRALALAHPAVIAIHDLRTRSSGTRTFIQFHLEMNGNLTLYEAHAISDAVMDEVESAFPGAEVLIHEDPHGVEEKRPLVA
jgi:ferrous-iron efflux pump FieF